MTRFLLIGTLAAWAIAIPAVAHDTWVQANSPLVRTGEAVYIDLMLGNHGNDHRDFKLASKLSPDYVKTFEVVAPDGHRYDLKPVMIDQGYAPKEGYWAARFVPAQPGLYVAAQTLDRIVNHGKPVHGYRSAKTFFLVSDSLDHPEMKAGDFAKPLGHRIELVPEVNPTIGLGPGRPIKVRLLFDGQPLPGVKVSFIPRGETLKEGDDPDHERTTDESGRAAFTPKTGNHYLVVAHYPRDEQGEGYESAHYAATLCVLVPEKCPCCGE